MDFKNLVFLQLLTINVFLVWISKADSTKNESAEVILPFRCHVCDVENCENIDSEPKVCTIADLSEDNKVGKSQLYQLTDVGYSPEKYPNPKFSCQKVTGSKDGIVNIVRRCQIRLDRSIACLHFDGKNRRDETYANISCSVCDTDGCSSSGTAYIWVSLLLSSCIFSIFNAFV